MYNKFTDWRARLSEFINVNSERPYEIGKWDCAIMVSGAVKAMTGDDLMRDFRDLYSSIEEGYELLKDIGHAATIRGFLVGELGKPFHIAYARTGDIVRKGPSVGIFYGSVGLLVGELLGPDGQVLKSGMISYKRHELREAFRG